MSGSGGDKVHTHTHTLSLVLPSCWCLCCATLRLHSAVQAKQKDKQAVGQLEKRLKAEQEARATVEKQLAEEKKRKKLEEATAAARAVALAAASRWRPVRRHTVPPFVHVVTARCLMFTHDRPPFSRGECTETLRRRITELETECKKLTMDIKMKEEQIRELELKVQVRSTNRAGFFFSFSQMLANICSPCTVS